MASKNGHNGWANYETWAVSLWIDNEQSSYNYVNELVKSSGNVYRAADMLKDEYDDSMPELAGVWSDLLRAALSSVDWIEVARAHKPDGWGNSDTAPEDEDDTEDE